MKSLKKLQITLAKKQLSNREAFAIKGGRRKIYNDIRKALRKLADLYQKGENPSMHEHNGTYCIEW